MHFDITFIQIIPKTHKKKQKRNKTLKQTTYKIKKINNVYFGFRTHFLFVTLQKGVSVINMLGII